MDKATAHEILRLNAELAQAQAREMALREALRDSVDGWCDARYVYQSARDYLEVAEAALASPASGWPAEVKALVRAFRVADKALRGLADTRSDADWAEAIAAKAPFEGVE